MKIKINGKAVHYCVHCEHEKIDKGNLDYVCEACDVMCF